VKGVLAMGNRINMKNDLFYLCSLIEFTARKTTNKRGAIVAALGIKGIEKQLYDAGVNHCLSFEQVSDEIIDYYNISQGDFDTITNCKYKIPSYMDIGKLYSIIILDCAENDEIETVCEETFKVFSSFISDEISRFSTDLYYQNPSYLEWSYRSGYLLD
jgi:hypothetical protein